MASQAVPMADSHPAHVHQLGCPPVPSLSGRPRKLLGFLHASQPFGVQLHEEAREERVKRWEQREVEVREE